MIPVGKYLPALTLTKCHNDSLCVALCAVPFFVCVYIYVTQRLCPPVFRVCVAAQSPSNIPSLTAAARQSLINNASFILKSGLTLAAFCLLPGARVRMYRLENKALKKKKKIHPWTKKNPPPTPNPTLLPMPPRYSILIKKLMNHIFIAFLS